jgi:tight adherence protein C
VDLDARDREDQGLMNANWMPIVAAALVFFAILALCIPLIGYQDRERVRRSLTLVLSKGSLADAGARERRGGPIWPIRNRLLAIGTHVIGDRTRERLRKHLAWTGKPTSEAFDSIIERKMLYLIVGLCFGLVLGMLFGGLWWITVPALGLIGFLLPDLLVYNEGLARTKEIQLALPDLLDLCVQSGLGLQAAFSRVAATQEGPVAAEFGRLLQEMQLGVSRAEAFQAMASRSKQEDLQRFVTAMLQVDRLGIPVAAVLREQARDMRAKRHSRAREMAQKVPVKILAPLMLCFLPGLFIIILGPAVITAIDVFSR